MFDFFKKNKNKDQKFGKEEANYVTQTTAEDWNGFKSLMEGSAIADKDLILRVLTMYTDGDQREKEIKNLSKTYTEVADKILPKLFLFLLQSYRVWHITILHTLYYRRLSGAS